MIKTLSKKRWLHPKQLYYKRDGIIDLRDIKDRTYWLKPGEAVVLYTNEYVQLNPNYFGLLLPRVQHGTDGIVISSSYIDPCWKGVVQLMATNLSEVPLGLKAESNIANLVILRNSEPIKISSGSEPDHYELNWKTIFNNPEHPKWSNRKRGKLLKFRHLIRTGWVFVTTGGIAILGAIEFFTAGIIYTVNFLLDIFRRTS